MIDIPLYLRGEDLGEVSKDKPILAEIKDILERKPDELPFASDRSRWDITLEIDGVSYIWTANLTSLRNFAHKWGRDETKWIGKLVELWTVRKDVFNKEKLVIYGKPAETQKKPSPKKAGSKTLADAFDDEVYTAEVN